LLGFEIAFAKNNAGAVRLFTFVPAGLAFAVICYVIRIGIYKKLPLLLKFFCVSRHGFHLTILPPFWGDFFSFFAL
jgi:hypothetical protein